MLTEWRSALVQHLSNATRRREPGAGWSVLLRLVRERWRNYAGHYAVGLLLIAVGSAATALTAWIMKDVVDEIFVKRDPTAMVLIPAAIAALFLIKGAATYAQEVWLSRIGNRLIAAYQEQFYAHLLKMDMTFYHDHTSHDLILRSSRGASAARSLIDLVVLGVGRDVLTLVALVFVMVQQDPLMALIVLVAGPIAALIVRQLGRIAKKAAQTEARSAARIIGLVRETSQGARIIKSFQLEGMLRGEMASAINTMQTTANSVARVRAAVNPLIEALGGLSAAGVVAYAGWQSLSGVQTPGSLFSFLTALLLAADPARRLSKFQIDLNAHAVAVGLMFDILDMPPSEADRPGAPSLLITRGNIQFEGVSFAYRRDKPVLHDLSFSLEGGKMTALVGASGGGKSTIFSLLQRFWGPMAGNIFIDGQSISDVALASLRRSITFVSQDVFLFEGSIRDNILAARPDATEAELKAAARAANADDFIMRLAGGYDTPVGELGNQISGGQRQRISIARAFLKDAPIILLDEPTSALDSHSEQMIQTALRDLIYGRTAVVIAHRFATIQRADYIHVIQDGRVAESGTHQELLSRGRHYAHLYQSQFAHPVNV